MQVSERLLAGWVAVACLTMASLSVPSVARADVYYYKDAAGIFHFTNDPMPGATLFLMDQDGDFADSMAFSNAIIDSEAYDEIIEQYAKSFDVEPALVKAVIRAESGFNRLARSPAGARGLMQLMPVTAKHHGCRNVFDARQNIAAGVKHLRTLIDRHGNNLKRVLAAYNAGSYQVERFRGIPPYAETRSYVARVLRFRTEYRRQERQERILQAKAERS